MANGAATAQAEEAEQEYEAALVGPLDVGFMLILPLALLADALDIILELLGVAIVPKLIGMILDVLTLPIGYWVAKRTGQIMSAREQRDEMRKQQAQQREQRATQRTQKGADGAPKKPTKKAWRKIGLFFFLELIPFVGIVPFWTIAVIGALRKR